MSYQRAVDPEEGPIGGAHWGGTSCERALDVYINHPPALTHPEGHPLNRLSHPLQAHAHTV